MNRKLRPYFNTLILFSLYTLCPRGWEEGGDDAKSAWPSDTLGYTRVTIASTKGRQADKRRSQPSKRCASSD